MRQVLRPTKYTHPYDQGDDPSRSVSPDSRAETPSPLLPASPPEYGLDWLFPETNLTVCASWAEPSLQHPIEEVESVTLAVITEEGEQFLQDLAEGSGPDWMTPYETCSFPCSPPSRPPLTEETPVTYESRGVSPLEPGDLAEELALWRQVHQYEAELQTLHVIQGRPDMQQFVEDVIRENPGIFSDPDFLAQARVQLAEDPRREVIQAILAAAALRARPSPMHRSPASAPRSPSPLPIPPPAASSRDTTPVPHSETEEGEVESNTDNTSENSDLAAARAREAVDFVNAVSRTPKGVASNA